MISPIQSRGAAPVGHIDELPPLEMTAIVYLRMWCEGGSSREQVHDDFILAFGHSIGSTHSATFSSFMLLLIHKSRRKIMRHQACCQCFGGDESAVANMIAAAAAGDIEDALLLASHLVPSKTAQELVKSAEEIGLAFDQMLGQFHTKFMPTHKIPKSKH
ncbi:hypothetical protein F9L33_00045 [Amylibacter sp. SFDW26]|uniref:hypothetical protein n=1 Tax=Amylibacter sp. SFDW26 TaxID=2652722 RepID=UPI00126143B5|nr:hypothetical protein [Amylibacter sp. SFDW26]KAB7615198.1 hypothetical protein F9L33_00045 [Amylibacter sp. SFDW26]